MSQHPDDLLILQLIDNLADADTTAAQRILARIALAPFSREPIRVPVRHRGLIYQGNALYRTVDSLSYHLVKRVLVEEQWSIGTTEGDYLRDLQQAASSTSARLVVYRRWRQPFAAVIVPTTDVVPAQRLGARWLPWLFVVYSASAATIATGYMISSRAELDLPGDVRWFS